MIVKLGTAERGVYGVAEMMVRPENRSTGVCGMMRRHLVLQLGPNSMIGRASQRNKELSLVDLLQLQLSTVYNLSVQPYSLDHIDEQG
jgi:hypothetical protein